MRRLRIGIYVPEECIDFLSVSFLDRNSFTISRAAASKMSERRAVLLRLCDCQLCTVKYRCQGSQKRTAAVAITRGKDFEHAKLISFLFYFYSLFCCAHFATRYSSSAVKP